MNAWKHHLSADFEQNPILLAKSTGPDAGATVFLDYGKMVRYLKENGRSWHVCEFECELDELELIYTNDWIARITVEKISPKGFHPLIVGE